MVRIWVCDTEMGRLIIFSRTFSGLTGVTQVGGGLDATLPVWTVNSESEALFCGDIHVQLIMFTGNTLSHPRDVLHSCSQLVGQYFVMDKIFENLLDVGHSAGCRRCLRHISH